MTEALDAIHNDGRFITDSDALAQRVADLIRIDGDNAYTGQYTEVFWDSEDPDATPQTQAFAWVSTNSNDTRMDGVYRSGECPITTAVITGEPDIDPLPISQFDDESWMTDDELDARERCVCGSVL